MSVFITNVDDFVGVSQACTNPFVNGNNEGIATTTSRTEKDPLGAKSRLKLNIDSSLSEYELKADLIKPVVHGGNGDGSEKSTIASVSLSDCLACSGCVTTAEAVLVQEHGYHQLLRKCADKQDSRIVWLQLQCLLVLVAGQTEPVRV